jgi:hypothetical protein
MRSFAGEMGKAQYGLKAFIAKIPMMITSLGQMGMAAWAALGPWGFLALAIGAVIAILAVTFPDEAKKAFNAIKSALKPFIDFFIGGIKLLVSGVLQLFKGLWDTVTNGVVLAFKAIGMIVEVGLQLIATYFKAVVAVFSTVWNVFVGVWKTTWALISAVVRSVIYIFTGQWGKLADVWRGFVDKIKAAWKTAWDRIVAVWTSVKDAFMSAVRIVVDFFVNNWDRIKNFAVGVYNVIVGALKTAAGAMMAVFAAIGAAFTAVWEGLKSAFKSVIDWISTKLDSVEQWFDDTVYSIGEFFSGLYDDIVQPVVDAFEEIGEAAEWLYDHTIGIFEGVGEFIYDLFGGSPQDAPIQAFNDIADTSDRMAERVVANTTRMGEGVAGVGRTVEQRLPSAFDVAEKATRDYFNHSNRTNQQFLEGFEGGWGQLRMTVSEAFEGMAAAGVQMTQGMADQMMRDAHTAAVRACVSARQLGATEEDISKASQEAWMDAFNSMVEGQKSVAQEAERQRQRLLDVYESTSVGVRTAFDNVATTISTNWFNAIGASEKFGEAQAEVMRTAPMPRRSLRRLRQRRNWLTRVR